MKKGGVLLLLLLPVIFVACRGVSATQVERDLYTKLDKGDVAGALALTTEDAVFDIPGCPQGGCKGKDAIKSAFEGAVAQHTRHTIKSSKDSKNTATSQVEDELDLAKAAGVQRVVLKVTMELKGDKIARFQAQFDTSDQQTATVVNFRRLSGILRQHVDALNRGDVAGLMATFTDDAVVDGRTTQCQANPCVGKVAIQRAMDIQVGAKVSYNIIDIQVSGDNATVRSDQRGEGVTGAGAERVIFIATLTFKGDKISRWVHKQDASDPQTATFINFQRVTGAHNRQTAALGRGDVAAVMVNFADDAVYEGLGLCASAPCVGKAGIQKEMEREAADKTNFTSLPFQALTRVSDDNMTRPRLEIRSDSIKAAGVERIIASATAVVKGDKISSLRYVLDQTDPQTATYLEPIQ